VNELIKFARQTLERQQERLSIPGSTPAIDWLSQWRELAQVTSDIEPDDPRLTPVLSALAVCESHYRKGNLDDFTKAATQVQRLMLFTPGATIRWHGHIEHRLMVLGPNTVECVHFADGRFWVWVAWDGGRWINETLITEIQEAR
jgi:hypothetical protein